MKHNRSWLKNVNPNYRDPPTEWHVRMEPELYENFHFYAPTKFGALRKAFRAMQVRAAFVVTRKLLE